MLDIATLRKLGQTPERNDPALNLALAEEGPLDLLFSLASCGAVTGDALAVIVGRIEGAGLTIEIDPSAPDEAPGIDELEYAIVAHPNAGAEARDAILARHEGDEAFLLAAATHAGATAHALEAAAEWPSHSPLHDRPWLKLLGRAASTEITERWARSGELLREAAATQASDPQILAQLARDSSRRVRRAVASNLAAGDRTALANDPAPEVRSRAQQARGDAATKVTFESALAAMQSGGALAHDVARALINAGPELDEEGAMLAARYFDDDGLLALVGMVTTSDDEALGPRGVGVGVGLSLRARTRSHGRAEQADDAFASMTTHIVHLVTRYPTQSTRLTGKARLAAWMADSLLRSKVIGVRDIARQAAPGTMVADRMVLARSLRARSDAMSDPPATGVAPALVEIAWSDPKVSDDDAVALAGRVASAEPRGKDLPEDELDLAPGCRSLAVLERAVLAAIARTPVSPRAALAAIALHPRRIRYILSAVPTWRGTMTGARLMRVLSAHAGALSAAAPTSSGPQPAGVARWTDRPLSEVEAAVAIAVGDLTVAELLRRLPAGKIKLQDGVTLAAGVEARAAIDGPSTFGKLLEYAASRRTTDPSALALWMLLEALDRPRAASLIASSLDGLSGTGSVVAPGVCEALATLERRAPGRLETIFAQSPRGRASVASAIARAYRSLGGMRDE